ncbi:MAG: acetylglutamate kinase [Dehalococcoidia bacterium]|nr:acetylglutamate kinase [Dehalococcoidia bacterium]
MSRNAALKPVVVKIGGSTLGNNDTAFQDIAALQRQGTPVVVVHGGGKVISEWQARSGTQARFVRGLRVTDAAALDVVVAVLCGLVNKQLVMALHTAGVQALGMSGADAGLLQGRPLDPELGYVGEITRVDPRPLEELLVLGYVPVVAPVALHMNEGGPMGFLNVNADTAAGAIAEALSATCLLFLTDAQGVLDGSGRLLGRLRPAEAQELVRSGVATAGMVPKLEACLRVLSTARRAHILDGRAPHALLDAVSGKPSGTLVEKG